MLRGLTYLQTVSGKNAGNVVLWMQPDGTLNPSAEPVELPDPSDSDASYWLARTIWALGEGYAAFKGADPAFARFLEQRLALAVDAVDRQVLDAYGRYLDIDGRRTPAWLIADGADASAEAVLGLAAYVRAGGSARPRRRDDPAEQRHRPARRRGRAHVALRRRAAVGTVPFGLARLGIADDRRRSRAPPTSPATRSWRRVAEREAFTFDPWMLTSGGPDNGRLPARADATQIAYGVDSRVQNLLATGGGARQLAGVVAAWFFGANASKAPTYDPATGITFDGVAPDGKPNQNSGAESTIHGLLTMIALDGDPAGEADRDDCSRPGGRRRPVRPGRGQSARRGRDRREAEVHLDRRVAVRRHRLRSSRDGGTATFELGSHPDALRAARGRPAARAALP